MDRNSIIGVVLIGLILIGYSIFTKPSREAQMEAIRRNDSIAQVEQMRQQQAELEKEREQPVSTVESTDRDSEQQAIRQREYGVFANSLTGDEEYITLENDLIKLQVSTKGGRPYSALLKNYTTYDSLPVILFDGDSSKFELQFFAENRRINTSNLFFVPDIENSNIRVSDASKTLKMRLNITAESYIEFIYTMHPGKYMIDYDIHLVGLDKLRADNLVYLYEIYFPSTEKGFQNENNYTTLYYRYRDGDIEKFNMRKKGVQEETATTQLEWIAYKHQFFSTVMIAKDPFESAYMMSEPFEDPGKYIRHFSSEIDLPYARTNDQTMSMAFYFGPNSHQILKKYKEWKLENLVTVGGSVIRWLNEFVIIPIFNWLNRYINNYGIIILLLTIIIKVALFPLTYKSFKSQAVMRVLKPQVDEISEKYPKKEDAMKKQQATMDLYKKAGANPLGGCLPMLLQLPILYAMFRFFPTSIELRGEKFLWADDLSTYDSILDLPFEIPMYGDHVSLFTLLMTVTTVLSMRINNQTQSTSAMPGMKTMMYIMPVMFMVFLNNFSAALTYYYFLANLITLGQNYFFKAFTDEEAILKKINARKAKPKKKSKWQARLEEMTKQQQQKQKSLGKRK
ncbi:MAG: membrane protein insertase YidC [Bacteroidales bacterium]|nr:membrane protein insertase YidC [Bacteroidales bacterium]